MGVDMCLFFKNVAYQQLFITSTFDCFSMHLPVHISGKHVDIFS